MDAINLEFIKKLKDSADGFKGLADAATSNFKNTFCATSESVNELNKAMESVNVKMKVVDISALIIDSNKPK